MHPESKRLPLHSGLRRLVVALLWGMMAWNQTVADDEDSLVAAGAGASSAGAASAAPAPEFPPFAEVSKGFEPVVSTTDGAHGLFALWVRKKDNQVLAELPQDFAGKKYFLAMTVASGEEYAGLQVGDIVVYWRQHDKRLALIEPNHAFRSSGDQESQDSVKRLFTDRLILDVPILTHGPHGGPVIDASSLFVGHSALFFGFGHQSGQPHLAVVKMAKSFPKNTELAFEAPMAGGRLKTLHYSISEIPDSSGYKPRIADQRIGYFTTGYADLGKFHEEGPRVRYINRWRIEKRDPALKLSPPKNPIVFYIEHTTPVRYRAYVKRGILSWNAAFEKVGIRECLEVRQQDAVTGEHMDKDPEDVRYNFVRWLNNDISTAIGPSRAHPLTGEILDADIILTDGWIRTYLSQQIDELPQLAMEGFSPATIAWLDRRPAWDPRMQFAPAAQRAELYAARQRQTQRPAASPGNNAAPDLTAQGGDRNPAATIRPGHPASLCRAATGLGTDLALMHMTHALLAGSRDKDQGAELLDGMPEEYIGGLLSYLTAHEVGHTLGLRHNFRASGIYSLEEINKPGAPRKVIAGSVMDYIPLNINVQQNKLVDNFAMEGVGPYDMWAIEYGYTFEDNLQPILARVAEPELQYATDEDSFGPDPLARLWDLGANPLEFARSQMSLAQQHRRELVDKFVRDGQSWAKARRGYETTLGLQMRALSIASDWVGGAHIHRDRKGDKNGRPPLEVVPAIAQRTALKFAIENAFQDQAFGLTPALLNHLALDQWLDDSHGFFSIPDAAWPVHERIMGIQGATLTMLLNPTQLGQVFDNELRAPTEVDVLTLPELLDTVYAAIWTELDQPIPADSTPRKPWLSSLRRNLQREHVERLIDLTLPDPFMGTVHKPVSNLALGQLDKLKQKVAALLQQNPGIDAYSRAHLAEAQIRITKALDAHYIYNNQNQQNPLMFLFR
ncbi:MAG: zinc-dependent metalloprotease [Planctomycetales bacterium]